MFRPTVHAAIIILALPCWLVCAPLRADDALERTLHHVEESGTKYASVSFENLLGSMTVRTDGRTRSVEVRARAVAEGATRDDANALLANVQLIREESAEGLSFRVGFPVDRHTAFKMPRSEVDGLLAKWVTPWVRRSTVTARYGDRTVQVGSIKGAAALAVHLEILLPLDMDSTFRQIVGPIHCSGLRGSLTLESLEGGAQVDQTYGSLSVRTAGGGIGVWNFHGEEIDLQSTSGDIELAEVEVERARFDTATGEISGSGIAAATLTAKTDSGPVTIEDFEPVLLELATGSGNIDLATHLKRLRQASIHSDSGDVTLRVGQLAPFELQAESETGSVKSKGVKVRVDQAAKNLANFRRGQGGADLEVRTQRGAVLLRSL